MHSAIFCPFWARVNAFRKWRDRTLHLLHFWQGFLPVSCGERTLSPFPLAFFFLREEAAGCFLGMVSFVVVVFLSFCLWYLLGFFLRKLDSASLHYIGLFRNWRCRIALIRPSQEINSAERYKIWTNLEQTWKQTSHTRSFPSQA